MGTGSYPAPSSTLSGGPTRSFRSPCGTLRPRDLRCARFAANTVGLERWTATNQCAFHRVDQDLAAQAGSAPLVVHVRSLAPHPVACHGPCPPRQGQEVRFELSHAFGGSLAAVPTCAKKMRLSDFCNRLHQTSTLGTARFPAASPPACDLRLTLRTAGSSWANGLTAPGVGNPDSAYRMRQPSGAPLDGEPPASASATTWTLGPRRRLAALLCRELPLPSPGMSPGSHDRPAQHSPGGASIESSSAPSLPIRAFSAADRACDVASDVLCRRPRVNPSTIARDQIPITVGRPTRLRRRLAKGRRLHRIRTPSIDECSLLRHLRFRANHACACASRLRARRRDHEETIAGGAETLPATNRSRCSRARGFHHCDPVPAPLHLPSLPGGRAGRLDPRAPKGRGPCAAHRLLQSKQPASTTTGSSDPRFTEHPRACACALHPTRQLSRSGTGASTLPPACARNLAFSPWNRGFRPHPRGLRLVAEAFASKLGRRWHRFASL
jgi:hypothetical protein